MLRVISVLLFLLLCTPISFARDIQVYNVSCSGDYLVRVIPEKNSSFSLKDCSIDSEVWHRFKCNCGTLVIQTDDEDLFYFQIQYYEGSEKNDDTKRILNLEKDTHYGFDFELPESPFIIIIVVFILFFAVVIAVTLIKREANKGDESEEPNNSKDYPDTDQEVQEQPKVNSLKSKIEELKSNNKMFK